MKTKPNQFERAQLSPLELRKKISVAAAAELNAMHPATFRRHHSHLIRRVGKRRQAVELGDAINLPPAAGVCRRGGQNHLTDSKRREG